MKRQTMAAGAISAAAILLISPVAGANTVDGQGGGYAEFAVSGAATNWTGTMSLGGGFPQTSFTSSARTAQRIGGTTNWLAASSPPGAKYGSSRNLPYLNVNPLSSTAADPQPSVTTYTFSNPTPAENWMFTLGDVDADYVVVSARGRDGDAVPAAALGFRGTFNYCLGPGSPSCSRPTDEPVWNPVTGELRGRGSDTDGASAWFEPTVQLTSLRFEFHRLSGTPIFQTWFATIARDINGRVSGCEEASGSPSDIPVALLRDGDVIAETTTSADGTYAFINYHAQSGYTVEIDEPEGCVTDRSFVPVSTASTDATGVDFVLRERTAEDDAIDEFTDEVDELAESLDLPIDLGTLLTPPDLTPGDPGSLDDIIQWKRGLLSW
ncbi:hypothetical protein [Hoyosella subflava]|uniref:LPXTG-motif cell wall anchor domain protein n=1 Tax=Hoyosella subflava (strain DSM 45089 / JCM 17490 / NBRC 109087 / DQS3-9A1) TaxID=443218 RepID=F6EKA0_HOYSD|nr:hypothetical protein [Hoyosella subflava]AEF42641.1 LPXTG-motif cell wall anchor domain protein [Hoyosella subflava DQS3-9A1]